MTIPASAEHPKEAAQFIAFLLGDEGRAIMEADHHPMFETFHVDGYTWHGHKLRFSMRLMRGAEAACSAHGSPAGWRNESVSTDLHELPTGGCARQDFSPPNPVGQKRNLCPLSVYENLPSVLQALTVSESN